MSRTSYDLQIVNRHPPFGTQVSDSDACSVVSDDGLASMHVYIHVYNNNNTHAFFAQIRDSISKLPKYAITVEQVS